MLLLYSNACQLQDSYIVTHSKVCAKQSCAKFSFSHVELPQTLGNTVAVRHQSRAAG